MEAQPSLLDWKAPVRSSDPETSRKAAESQRDTLCEKQEKVLHVIKHNGPMTDETLAHWCWRFYQWPPSKSTARSRRKELVTKGLVEATGETVKLPSGRSAMTWRAK